MCTSFCFSRVVSVALLALVVTDTQWARAAEPRLENKSRFTMTPVEGGVMRLDTETGAVSLCVRKAETWSCEPVNDQLSGGAMAKLEAENRELRDRIKSLEDSPAAGQPQPTPTPPNDGGYPTEPPGGVTKLPSEEDVDRALDYMERIFKKFRDRIKKYEEPGVPVKPGGGTSGGGAL